MPGAPLVGERKHHEALTRLGRTTSWRGAARHLSQHLRLSSPRLPDDAKDVDNMISPFLSRPSDLETLAAALPSASVIAANGRSCKIGIIVCRRWCCSILPRAQGKGIAGPLSKSSLARVEQLPGRPEKTFLLR